jgi:ArsR family transcriptional regulator, virulence genes transcriptional regulator
MNTFSGLPAGVITLVTERLRALGDETRVLLICELAKGECNVGGLVEALGIAQASVSKHLRVLRKAGIVQVRREGAQAMYSIRDDSVFEVLLFLSSSLIKQHRELGDAMGVNEKGEG